MTCKRLEANLGWFVVAPLVPCAVRHEGALGAFETHDAKGILLRVAANRDRRLHHVGVAHRPLKRLLRAHREADHRPQMFDAELFGEKPVRGVHVVPDRDLWKVGSRERRRRVAGRRREPIGKHVRGHDEVFGRVESFSRPTEKLVAVVIA